MYQNIINILHVENNNKLVIDTNDVIIFFHNVIFYSFILLHSY